MYASSTLHWTLLSICDCKIVVSQRTRMTIAMLVMQGLTGSFDSLTGSPDLHLTQSQEFLKFTTLEPGAPYAKVT